MFKDYGRSNGMKTTCVETIISDDAEGVKRNECFDAGHQKNQNFWFDEKLVRMEKIFDLLQKRNERRLTVVYQTASDMKFDRCVNENEANMDAVQCFMAEHGSMKVHFRQ